MKNHNLVFSCIVVLVCLSLYETSMTSMDLEWEKTTISNQTFSAGMSETNKIEPPEYSGSDKYSHF